MTLQETIIAQLGVKPSIDPKEEIRKSVDFLKAYMLKHPSVSYTHLTLPTILRV